ncbi:MAG: TIGR01212 family radical SAM protein, partial [Lachnospiraceae bacterium]|nr:TIGR01212 family radical SAM protein [Lachnospiraceae bacterium]
AHMTCPNRDGTLDTRGCIFCSAGGSGDFAVSNRGKSISAQLKEGVSLFRGKRTGNDFIAYFQAYTNTYAPLSYLEQIYTEALSCPDVCGISIATRPDCLPKEVLELLGTLRERFPPKFVWVELGLQTIWENTAAFIRRGYTLSCFEEAFGELTQLEIPVIVHTILGLPGEEEEQMLATIAYLNERHPFGIKLQLLHVLRDTDLAEYYLSGSFDVLSKEAYLQLLVKCLTRLSPDIVVHRVTGDGPKNLLIAPKWSADKRDVLNTLHQYMRKQNLLQGSSYQASEYN